MAVILVDLGRVMGGLLVCAGIALLPRRRRAARERVADGGFSGLGWDNVERRVPAARELRSICRALDCQAARPGGKRVGAMI